MLITKFNKMIKSKIIWGGFAVIISFFFVGTGLSLKGSKRANNDAVGVGELYGETISRQAFSMARYFELGMTHNAPNLDTEQAAELRKNVWRRIASIENARSMNLEATDAELNTAIQAEPSFARDGIFDKATYKAIIERSKGVPLRVFEDNVRQQITMHKLQQMMWLFAWTPHSETEQQLSDMTDNFEIEYIAVTANDIDNPINLSDKDYIEFFAENQEMFRVPDQINVRYVSFPITNYIAQVSVDNTDVQDYYYDHTNDFTTVTTNNAIVLKNLEDVTGEIEKILKHRLAKLEAQRDAAKFEMFIVRGGENNKPLTMEQAAKTKKLTILKSKFFSLHSPVPELNVDESFNREAFALIPNSTHYFSSSIMGQDNAYIIATETNIPSHIPEFNTIARDVMPLAKEYATKTALKEKTTRVHNEIAISLATGEAFSNIVKKVGFKMQKPRQFSIYEMQTAGMYGAISNDLEQVQLFAPAIAKLQQGELTEPIDIGDSSIIAHIAKRTPPEPFLKNMLKPRLQESMDGYKASALFADWKDYILKDAQFEDYVAQRAEAR